MRILCICLLCALFSGCASAPKSVWVHPERTTAGLEQDEAQCNYEIGKIHAQNAIPEEQREQLFVDCMKAKAWRLEKR